MDVHGWWKRWLILLSVTVMGGGCTAVPEMPMGRAIDDASRAVQVMQERAQELTALRAEMASTRIAAAKQAAELHELQATVTQLRKDNGDVQQALHEATQRLQARDTEVATLKAERDQFAQVSASSTAQDHQLTTLHDRVASLQRELIELRTAMAVPHQSGPSSHQSDEAFATASQSQPMVKQPALWSTSAREPVDRNMLTVPAIPAVHLVSPARGAANQTWITVQPGDSWWSLARKYRTRITTLRAVNGREGDHLVVGESIRVP